MACSLTAEGKALRKLARMARRTERKRREAAYERFCQRELGASLEEVIRRQRYRPLESQGGKV